MDAKTRADNRIRQQRYRELNREEINEKRRERYEERKLKNRCPRCDGKVKKGHTLCEKCCDYQSALNKKYAKKIKKAADTAKKKAAPKINKKAAIDRKKAVKTTAKKQQKRLLPQKTSKKNR